jgi:hypothetical protein
VIVLTISVFAIALLLHYHKGAQRIAQFWTSATPMVAEYK